MCYRASMTGSRRQSLGIGLIAALAFAAPATAAAPAPAGEAELAEMLEGRVAGEPVDCIRSDSAQGMQIVDGTAMVFRRGNTLYVNRPDGARSLDEWDLPVIHQFGSQLCKQDRIELRDRTSNISGPSVFLARFVPYTRPVR